MITDPPRGIGGKRVVIIGAGNLGSKLALKLVERGADVVITRHDREKLVTIVRALNYIKPKETMAEVVGTTDNQEAVREANILISLTNGIPAITASMIESLAPGALIMDGGKGCLYPSAIRTAEDLGLTVLRVDVRAGFEGQVAMLLEMERIVRTTIRRRKVNGLSIVSGGLLAHRDEIVVDNIYGVKRIQPSEYTTLNQQRKSIHAESNIKKSEIIDSGDLVIKGPAGGLLPEYLNIVIGREAKKTFNEIIR